MSRFERYWFGGVQAVRSRLLLRGVLVLLALDLWLVRVEHGGRYGAGSFNVAHFSWLDALQPPPTAALYVGVTLLSGLLAVTMVFAGPCRSGAALLAALYTYAWAMSMLDSYQHHYLLSWVLLCFVFWPSVDVVEKRGGSVRGWVLPSAWAYPLLANTLAVVYVFAGLSKLEPEWATGVIVRRLVLADERLRPLALRLGDSAELWRACAFAIVFTQVLVAAGYAFYGHGRRPETRLGRALRWAFFVAACAFHVGAELLGLRIGWFSYYMIFMAMLVFLPERWLAVLWTPFGLVAEAIARVSGSARLADRSQVAGLVLAAASGSVAIVMGVLIDLPGALPAMAVASGFLVVYAVWTGLRQRPSLGLRASAALTLSATLMTGCLTFSDVRFDYYRYVAGDARRRGDYKAALAAYQKANRYAQGGKNRSAQERAMRRLLDEPR